MLILGPFFMIATPSQHPPYLANDDADLFSREHSVLSANVSSHKLKRKMAGDRHCQLKFGTSFSKTTLGVCCLSWRQQPRLPNSISSLDHRKGGLRLLNFISRAPSCRYMLSLLGSGRTSPIYRIVLISVSWKIPEPYALMSVAAPILPPRPMELALWILQLKSRMAYRNGLWAIIPSLLQWRYLKYETQIFEVCDLSVM